MALFGKKKQETKPEETAAPVTANGSGGKSAEPPKAAGTADGVFDYSPDKAAKFFDRAQTLHDATNFGYAMQLWLGGLRQDPTSMSGLEGFVRSAQAYATEKKVKAPERDIAKQFPGGKSDLDRYLHELLMWGCRITDPSPGIRAMQTAAKLGLSGPAVWIAERAVGAAAQEKRPRKEYFVAGMEVLEKFGKYDKAVWAGEAAVRLNPTDGRLAQRVKNISAESTMHRGGFDQPGQEGGFRSNIRDSQKQRQLDDQERVVRTEETLDRMIEEARAAYAASPMDRPTIGKYGKLLMERRTPADEEAAYQVYQGAYEQTREFRFKELAEQIRLSQGRRRLAKLRAAAEQAGADEAAQEAYRRGQQELQIRIIKHFEELVAAYPTDLIKKFDLGKAYFNLGRYDDAVGLLQEARADPKHRASVLSYLGRSFLHMPGYTDEAIETLRQALESHDTPNDEVGMELRHGLMSALEARAKETGDLANAEEAFKIASGITIQNISYKDVRKRRDEIKALIAQLKGGAGGAAG